ncbi:5-hydroxytryptamine receptor 3A [Takifugu flavidus]|uniref:5-hydroxytryptamine receptor 3A n=1 Tax=Takifugu flavidus TaxID=433684 RepID=A0A5C6PTK8_9TELE|nr:5-hydroxytryptamine receptor 3A [Takifugu flavidus]
MKNHDWPQRGHVYGKEQWPQHPSLGDPNVELARSQTLTHRECRPREVRFRPAKCSAEMLPSERTEPVKQNAVTLKKVCSYQDVLDHLNLTTDNNVFRLTRPVLDHTQPTTVELDIILFAILSVVEKTQTFIPFIWASMRWNNHRISWDPEEFCGITKVSVPQDILWKPDLCIYEMIQKDESPLDPYVKVTYDGHVTSDQDVKVVSTCKMDVHKFPFDTQSCNITIGSANYCAKEIRLVPFSNSSRATQFSRELIKTQGEWEFLQLSVTRTNFSIQDKIWENLIYTVR